MSHSNENATCEKCEEIMARYPGLDPDLAQWFRNLRGTHLDCHTSCAGRGSVDQESCFTAGTSEAHWTQSAHNWNQALDLFKLDENGKAQWPPMWYNDFLRNDPAIGDWLTWGATWTTFKEYPHVQCSDWKDKAKSGMAVLVE